MRSDGWIKTTDKLPPPNIRVLIWWDHGDIDKNGKNKPGVSIGSYRVRVNEFRAQGCNYDSRNEISHWRFMPDKPVNKRRSNVRKIKRTKT
jgi:hypothetical protein